VLETGDLAVHEEEVYPSDTLTAIGSGVTVGAPVRAPEAAVQVEE
jgi:hypothetical protein